MKERSRSKTQMPASKKKISRGEYVLKLENQEKIFTFKDCLTKDRLQELDVDETYDAKKNTISLSGGTKSGLKY